MSQSQHPLILGKKSLILAPMEGVTDAPMRAFFAERGGITHCVSEFIRISESVPSAKVFGSHVPELETGGRAAGNLLVQVQLLGGHPERLAEAALRAIEAGAPGIDLNFGCPAPTVNRNDGGATLLKYPARIRMICEAVRKAVPKAMPVSAKLRLGWDDPDAIFENAQQAAKGGVSWITIHARTRMQGYQPPADWRRIGAVRQELENSSQSSGGIPVIANGDLFTLDDLKRCQDETGCQHFMIGRGAMANPGIAQEMANYLGIIDQRGLRKNESDSPDFTQASAWHAAILELGHHLSPDQTKNSYLLRRSKQWLGFAKARGGIGWFDEVKRCQTLEELLSALIRL